MERRRRQRLWEMSILWEKSAGWRWLVRRTRDSKPFFFTFAALCGVVPGVIGYGVMQLTGSRNEQLEAHLRSTARPETTVRASASLLQIPPWSMVAIIDCCYKLFSSIWDHCSGNYGWLVDLVYMFNQFLTWNSRISKTRQHVWGIDGAELGFEPYLLRDIM